MNLASWFEEFKAAAEAEYAQEEAKWRRRTSLDSYSGSNDLPH
jgi:hypothetical protein